MSAENPDQHVPAGAPEPDDGETTEGETTETETTETETTET